jgi:hypothetical protein
VAIAKAIHFGAACLPGKEFIHGDVNTANGYLKRNSGLPPGCDQAPVHGGYQKVLSAPLYKMLLDFGEVIVIVHQDPDINFAIR